MEAFDWQDYDWVRAVTSSAVYDVAIETPLTPAPRLSARLRNTILLKREDLQPVFSFKLRGAYNRMAALTTEERSRGVICASAGNHAQGVALAASRLEIDALIVMPETTPQIKVSAVERLGGKVALYGDSYSDAGAHAEALRRESGRIFIHPYDDPAVIAGQGTIADELLRQTPGDIDAVFIPIGGGGLIAGIAAYLRRESPETRIIGVEPVDSAAMYDSLRAGRRVTLDQVGIFADGVAVKRVGRITFEMVRALVDEIVLVDTDQICGAIKAIYEDARVITEPAGALAVAAAGVVCARDGLRGRRIVCINSGANMNFDRLRHVAERAEIGERREALFAVTIPERPGSFLQFCNAIGRRNITEFNYRLSSREAAHIFVGISIDGAHEAEEIRLQLERAGYPVLPLIDNELAKLHLRHLVGGRAPLVRHEQLYRFEFPERPGALGDFLNHLAGRWNISLFHYRNHGAAYGRVLVGMEAVDEERATLEHFFDEIGYPYTCESDNVVRSLFL
ncbi:MAG: threonine ammonia-lyase, biosynthetic [Zetaproteobacteria bacterium]|nr:MAG: threonine ammonia-lyase, biosynthetic [Zetaproteobacteria bacterium]